MIRHLKFTLAALALLVTTDMVHAQAPVPTTPLTYNQARAMNQFLNSQYSYRTYSGPTPGFYYEIATPYGTQYVSRGNGYARLSITPWGSSGFQYVPPTLYETAPRDVLTYPVPALVPYPSGALWVR
jgi:hypothetical protein